MKERRCRQAGKRGHATRLGRRAPPRLGSWPGRVTGPDDRIRDTEGSGPVKLGSVARHRLRVRPSRSTIGESGGARRASLPPRWVAKRPQFQGHLICQKSSSHDRRLRPASFARAQGSCRRHPVVCVDGSSPWRPPDLAHGTPVWDIVPNPASKSTCAAQRRRERDESGCI